VECHLCKDGGGATTNLVSLDKSDERGDPPQIEAKAVKNKGRGPRGIREKGGAYDKRPGQHGRGPNLLGEMTARAPEKGWVADDPRNKITDDGGHSRTSCASFPRSLETEKK